MIIVVLPSSLARCRERNLTFTCVFVSKRAVISSTAFGCLRLAEFLGTTAENESWNLPYLPQTAINVLALDLAPSQRPPSFLDFHHASTSCEVFIFAVPDGFRKGFGGKVRRFDRGTSRTSKLVASGLSQVGRSARLTKSREFSAVRKVFIGSRRTTNRRYACTSDVKLSSVRFPALNLRS